MKKRIFASYEKKVYGLKDALDTSHKKTKMNEKSKKK